MAQQGFYLTDHSIGHKFFRTYQNLRQYTVLTEEEPRTDIEPPGNMIDNESYMTDHRAGQDLFGY